MWGGGGGGRGVAVAASPLPLPLAGPVTIDAKTTGHCSPEMAVYNTIDLFLEGQNQFFSKRFWSYLLAGAPIKRVANQ